METWQPPELLYFSVIRSLDRIGSVVHDGFNTEEAELIRSQSRAILLKAKPIVLSEDIICDASHRANAPTFNTRSPDHPFDFYWIQGEKSQAFLKSDNPDNNKSIWVNGMAIGRFGDKYVAIFLNYNNGEICFDGVVVDRSVQHPAGSKPSFANKWICGLCDILQERDTYVGQEKINFRQRIGTGPSRHLHKVNQIIRIVRKKEIARYAAQSSNDIEWSHCWSVMGHWRSIPGTSIGKDSSGQYNQSGRTWIRPCVKGNKSAPYVNKLRHFIGGN